MEYPGIYPGEENTWDLDKFESVRYATPLPNSSTPHLLISQPLLNAKRPHLCPWMNATKQNLRIETKTLTQSTIEFDLIGVDASIANALRRVLIAEVRTKSPPPDILHTDTQSIPPPRSPRSRRSQQSPSKTSTSTATPPSCKTRCWPTGWD